MHQIVLPSAPESVVAAVHFVEAVAGAEALPGPLVERLLLAASEAVANATKHGNRSERERLVRVTWSGDGGGGTLTVEDEGPGLPVERFIAARLPEDPFQTNGRGLFLIRTLSDGLECEGGRLRMRFLPRPEERG